jgi:phosphomannomutase
VLAFATRRLSCAAGVMITASHNPPQDNGYKVYLGDGAQIVAPVDDAIAERIRAVTGLSEVPLGSLAEPLGDDVVDAYVRTIARLARGGDQPHLEVVYTPLHGVGRDVLLSAFERAGLAPPGVVAAQGLPDARRDGVDLGRRLDQLAVRFGLHATTQVVAELASGARDADAEEIMRRLRARPPRRLLDEPVTETEDLLVGGRLPRSNVMIFRCRERIRVVVRPSGTEPKLKMYLQVVEEMRDGAAHAVRRRASQRLEALAGELHQVVLG